MTAPPDWPTRDLLSHRAEATPDRIAVVDSRDGSTWRYRALDRLVDGATRRLRASLPADRSTDDSARIGFLASTRVAFVVALHAAFRAGAVAVPLNVELPETDLGDQARRADIDAVVCERDTAETARSITDAPVFSLDAPGSNGIDALEPMADPEDSSESATESSRNGVEPAAWEPDDLAVILFTSGTTGDPKGVRLTLGNLVASATASAFRLGVAPDDRWLCCLPVYHMGGLAPMVRTTLYGTGLIVQSSFDARATADAIAAHDATGVSLVPTQLTRLLDDGWEPPPTLDTVLLGGAPASRDLVERALDRGVPVAPTYGLTEAASQVATATPSTAASHPETVGQPLVCTDVTLVAGEPVDPGQTGELVVSGPTVTPGYLDDERTAAAFGEHGLATGDLAVRDADGRLRILGRVDDRIVTGGENVAPASVVEALASHPAVTEAAVVGLSDEEWGERVAALVVPDGDGLTADDVTAHASDRLASFAVPKTIKFAKALPRTSSGTVDREAVREQLRD